MAYWLKPISLVENIGNGFFKLNDREIKEQKGTASTWNDVEFPKTEVNVYSDEYRISSVSCYSTRVEFGEDKLKAIRLEFVNVNDPNDIVVTPVAGVKPHNKNWSYTLCLSPDEHLTGMSLIRNCNDIQFKTSTGRIVEMKSGFEKSWSEIWELPPGFRIYGFHGTFDERITFIGPIFKVIEFKHWNQSLYKALPLPFRSKMESILLIRNRHKNRPPPAATMDFWMIPEPVWDRIINQLLYSFYHDMNPDVFYTNLHHFRS